MGRYDGERVLVTGGGSGIGEAMVELLAAEGAEVVVADVDEEKAAAVASRTGSVAERFDQSSPVDWQRITDAHEFTIGVINAGVDGRYPELAAVTDEQMHRILGVNLHGVLYGTRELTRTMYLRGGGRISVTASIGGLTAHRMSPVYAASKAGVIGWIRSAAPELEGLGVRINGVCPALVDTPILGPGGGDMVRSMGFKTLTSAEVAAAHDLALSSAGTGQLYLVQVGRDVVPYEFAPVPGSQG